MTKLVECALEKKIERHKRPITERFWEKVQKTDKCWEWTASLGSRGYGQFMVSTGNITKAHRMAWKLTYGEIPDKMEVLHNCDNPICCRPDHLFLGTQIDNINDMVRKKRNGFKSQPGETNGNHKYTTEQVLAIREKLHLGLPGRQISRELNVPEDIISLIKLNKIWKNVQAPSTEDGLPQKEEEGA